MTEPDKRLEPELPEPSPAVRDAIRKQVAADLGPVRALSLHVRMLLVMLAVTTSLGVAVFTYWVLIGKKAFEEASTHRESIVVALGVVVLTTGAMALFYSRRWRRISLLARILPAGALSLGWFVYLGILMKAPAPESAFAEGSFFCGGVTLVAGIFAALTSFRIFRHTDPFTPRLSGALVGAAAGCAAAAGSGIVCGVNDGGHLFMGHGVEVLIMMAAAILAGRRVMTP